MAVEGDPNGGYRGGEPGKLRNAVAAALWTGGPLPQPMVELMLMRDVFHCTPSELDEQDAERIFEVLACLRAEQDVAEARAQSK